MLLNSIASSFKFSLPSDIIPDSVISRYTPLLEKNWVPYENVLDYLNSTIQAVDFPGLSIDLPEQTLIRNKVRSYKPSTNIFDTVSSHEINILFRRADADLNFWILHGIFKYHYADADNLFVKPFQISALDINRDEVYKINFLEIILKNMSEITFNYSEQDVQLRTFNLTFNFNYYDIEFMLDQRKVLTVGKDGIPIITQKDILN